MLVKLAPVKVSSNNTRHFRLKGSTKCHRINFFHFLDSDFDVFLKIKVMFESRIKNFLINFPRIIKPINNHYKCKIGTTLEGGQFHILFEWPPIENVTKQV